MTKARIVAEDYHRPASHDYEICRDICIQRLGQVLILYVTADVCRSSLLVEMEDVPFTNTPWGFEITLYEFALLE